MSTGNERLGPTPRRFGTPMLVFMAIIGLLAGLLIGSSLSDRPAAKGLDLIGAKKVSVTTRSPSLSAGNFVELAKRVKPGVVNISTTKVIKGGGRVFRHFSPPSRERDPFRDFFGEDFFDRFFGETPQKDYVQRSLGSGVIIDREGYILTNNHVIEGASEILVRLSTEKEFEAEVIGRDPKTDLALIKIKSGQDLPVEELGDSDKLEIGEWVMAIGNPFGLSQTVTVGIVSAKGRVIGSGPYDDYIQTDASINPGNSGGPLLDINGKLIGINTAIYANAQGIGFAIPINKAKRILSDLIKYGEVIPAWTGIVLQNIDTKLAHYLQIPGKGGVAVKGVERHSPAEKTGIVEGDIILSLNQKTVSSLDDYTAIMKGISAGHVIEVMIWRGGKKNLFKITTEIYPIENAIPLAYQLLGIRVKNLSDLSQTGVEIDKLDPDSYLSRIGVTPGDIIRQIDDQTINNLEDFKKAIVKFRQKISIVILLVRGGRGYYISLTL